MKILFLLPALILSTKVFSQSGDPNRSLADSLAAGQTKYLVVGQGGGFSGQVLKYYIFGNGDVYKVNSLTKQDSLVKTLSKKETRCIFKKLDGLDLEKTDFNHPGNMSYFIEQHRDSLVKNVTWGHHSMQAPAGIAGFYEFVMNKISVKK